MTREAACPALLQDRGCRAAGGQSPACGWQLLGDSGVRAFLCWGPAAPARFCRKLSAASVSSWPQIGLVGPRSTPTWQAPCTEVTAWGRGRPGVCWLLLPHASSSSSSREWPRRSLCWRQAGTASLAPSPSSRLYIAGSEGDPLVGMWGLVGNPMGVQQGARPQALHLHPSLWRQA